jgi:hypothetical protein
VLVQIAWLLAVSAFSSPTPWERADASGEIFEGMSPQDFGLRPGNPLDELPPPDLIEAPNKMLDPRSHDLNTTVLRPMLGRNFDPQFMSITRPRYVNISSLQMSLLPLYSSLLCSSFCCIAFLCLVFHCSTSTTGKTHLKFN